MAIGAFGAEVLEFCLDALGRPAPRPSATLGAGARKSIGGARAAVEAAYDPLLYEVVEVCDRGGALDAGGLLVVGAGELSYAQDG